MVSELSQLFEVKAEIHQVSVLSPFLFIVVVVLVVVVLCAS